MNDELVKIAGRRRTNEARERSPVEFEVIRDKERFRALEPEWNELHKSVPHSYFSQSFAWCDVALETVAEPLRANLYCLVARCNDELVLVWPWTLYRKGPCRFARQLGSGFFEWQVLLMAVSEDSSRLISEAWQHLKATMPADIIELRRVREGSPLLPLVQVEPAPRLTDPERFSAVEWDELNNWDDYIVSRDRNYLKDKQRCLRRLRERGHVSFDIVTSAEEFDELVAWIWQHKREWMRRTNRQNPWIDRADYRKFLTDIKARHSSSGYLALFVLRLNGSTIAAELATIDKAWVGSFVSTFDHQWGKYSPGQILQEMVLRWCFERRLGYDLGVGTEPYKKLCLNREGQALTFTLPISRRGRVCFASKWWLTGFKTRFWMALPLTIRTAIKRGLKLPSTI